MRRRLIDDLNTFEYLNSKKAKVLKDSASKQNSTNKTDQRPTNKIDEKKKVAEISSKPPPSSEISEEETKMVVEQIASDKKSTLNVKISQPQVNSSSSNQRILKAPSTLEPPSKIEPPKKPDDHPFNTTIQSSDTAISNITVNFNLFSVQVKNRSLPEIYIHTLAFSPKISNPMMRYSYVDQHFQKLGIRSPWSCDAKFLYAFEDFTSQSDCKLQINIHFNPTSNFKSHQKKKKIVKKKK